MKLTNEACVILGVAVGATEADISAAVIQLKNELDTANREKSEQETRATTAENKLAEIEKAENETRKTEAVNLINAAKLDGRINAADSKAVKAWEDAFGANHENAKTLLNGMPKHTPVSPTLGTGAGSADNKLLNQSWDELDRSGKLPDLKANHPDVYADKFAEKFGHKPTV